MTARFLLSPAAKTLSLASVARMSDKEVETTFIRLRWPENNGEAYCPKCGCTTVYASRRKGSLRWQCKACQKDFSLTSGTLFASRKMTLRAYLLAIAIFVNEVKGKSMLAMSRDLGTTYKTSFVLAHKLREAIGSQVSNPDEPELAGMVAIDGAYFGGKVKPANRKEDRADRRTAEEQTGKRQVVVVAREVMGRTLPFVVPRESAAVPLIRKHVASGTTVHADESGAWDALHASYPMLRVNHSREFKSEDGACTNEAESWFSRLRRSEMGIHHRISGQYLYQYANEMAWREDHRREPNGLHFRRVTGAALRHPKSQNLVAAIGNGAQHD